jgi:hypothetical protein
LWRGTNPTVAGLNKQQTADETAQVFSIPEFDVIERWFRINVNLFKSPLSRNQDELLQGFINK